MLSFAGATLVAPFTHNSSTSEGEKCLISRSCGDTLINCDHGANAKLPNAQPGAFDRLREGGAGVGNDLAVSKAWLTGSADEKGKEGRENGRDLVARKVRLANGMSALTGSSQPPELLP